MHVSLVDRTNELRATFRKKFSCDPEVIVRAPGRVNLIGEHTDYNGGFVLPAAIDREVLIAADTNSNSRSEGIVELYSAEYDQSDSFSTQKLELSSDKTWSNYVRGVIAVLQAETGKVQGFRAVISGNVPQGAGLSSSAALEVATATLLNQLQRADLDGVKIALLAQKAENDFVGVKCGIMDQFVSSLAERGSALMIDCRDLSYAAIPLNLESQTVVLAITHTGVSRDLASSKFNERRAECEEGLKILKDRLQKSSKNAANDGDVENEIVTLRDLSEEVLKDRAQDLPDLIAKRVRHVVSENQRVRRAAELLRKGDLVSFGKLMNESHQSLKVDYEVSCKELDILVELTQNHGALGARMTGAGFGGCTVALLKRSDLPGFVENVLPDYERKSGCKPALHVCEAVAGAGILESAL